MPETWKGRAREVIKIKDFTVDRGDGGRVREEEWVGPGAGVGGLLRQLRRTELNSDMRELYDTGNPHKRIALSTPIKTPEDDDEPLEEWTFRTEFKQRDLFTLPGPDSEAAAFTPPTAYRQKIEDAVRKGEALPAVLAALTWAPKIYDHLIHRITGYEDDTVAIRRFRRAPRDYAFQRAVYSSRLVYSQDQIGYDGTVSPFFSFPDLASREIPENTILGFRLRSQVYRVSDRIAEETVEWLLGFWSLLYYSAAGGAY